MLAKFRDSLAAAFEHLLCGGGGEHLLGVFGLAGGEGVQFGVFEEDEDDEVSADELGGGDDDFGPAGAFGHLSDPDDKAAAALKVFQAGGCVEVIGFSALAADLR